jgi:hypothetical protein
MCGQHLANLPPSVINEGLEDECGRQALRNHNGVVATAQKRPVAEVGFYRIRPPLKPLTLGELASLNIEEEQA